MKRRRRTADGWCARTYPTPTPPPWRRLAGRAAGGSLKAAAALTGRVDAAYEVGGARGVARTAITAPATRLITAGVAPVPRMLKEGVLLGLGTDGAASNNDLNMWEEMDTVAKLHKVFTGDPKVISAQQAFEFATIRGAQALHLDKEIGSLEVGKRADLLVVDRDTLNQIPVYNIYSDLVYATKAADVDSVIINGRIVMRDRRLLTLNETTVKNDARALRDKIMKSVSSSGTP